jgi:hypothetical protein
MLLSDVLINFMEGDDKPKLHFFCAVVWEFFPELNGVLREDGAFRFDEFKDLGDHVFLGATGF